MNVRLTVIAMVAAVGLVPGQVSAQGPAPAGVQPAAATAPRAAGAAPATHTAVIDIGYIFKHHARFKAAMEKMKDEVMAAENSLKAEKDRINGLIEQLRGLVVGTPDFKKLEAEVAKAQGDFQVNAGLQKKDFMDREAKVYMQVYGEIEEAVKQFARQHGIAVVHRFDGEPVDAANRDRILGNIMKPIVYHDPLIDITPDILRMLNNASVAGVPAAQPR